MGRTWNHVSDDVAKGGTENREPGEEGEVLEIDSHVGDSHHDKSTLRGRGTQAVSSRNQGHQAQGHRQPLDRPIEVRRKGPSRDERREQLRIHGEQEPGSNEQIKSFTQRYGVEFPVTEKADVNGPNAHPFFVYLKEKGPKSFLGTDAKWNFEKFLVDKKGNVVKRYLSTTSPLDIVKDIEAII